jgi:hypothetical protein
LVPRNSEAEIDVGSIFIPPHTSVWTLRPAGGDWKKIASSKPNGRCYSLRTFTNKPRYYALIKGEKWGIG